MKKRFFTASFGFPALVLACLTSLPVSKPGENDKHILTASTTSVEIIGLWECQYVVDNLGQEPLCYSIDVLPDHTITTKSLGGDGVTYFSAGAWEYNGSNFTAYISTPKDGIISPVKQTIKAKYNGESLVEATWFDTENLNPGSKINSGRFINFQRIIPALKLEDLVTKAKKPKQVANP